MKKALGFFFICVFVVALGRAFALPLMGKHFDAKYPSFPYGSTDPYGYAYCVVATNLYYTPEKPYVRSFLPVAESPTKRFSQKKTSSPGRLKKQIIVPKNKPNR
ncbi:hypothetical protein IT6_08380 [Methylacidiphilum caldifontis]|uniref:hypothetical protein n=1 Tax=Methylacidiphilum caldifontis TaxID=2795386 RepID=UPI001A8EE072|nr:hypothetical protein [Methylacidiphilum caldifontis]QSR88385.1 hypothetical protein IT6_08380 [Methylacidiphilum caldifontis]